MIRQKESCRKIKVLEMRDFPDITNAITRVLKTGSVMEANKGQDGKTSEAEIGVLDQGCEEGSSQ